MLRLTEPDFGSNPARGAHHRQTLRRRLGAQRRQDVDHQRIGRRRRGDRARTDEGIRGFVVPTDAPGFTAHTIKSKMSLRASVTGELVLDNVRLPEAARLELADERRPPKQVCNAIRGTGESDNISIRKRDDIGAVSIGGMP
jgi:glutaryl-CoA dehydrogenase